MPRRNRKTDLPQDEVRRHVWRHNSFFGHARMMISQCENIVQSKSASAEAKATALRISSEAHNLIKQLKERIDK